MDEETDRRLRRVEADVQALRLLLAEMLRHTTDPETIVAWQDRLVAGFESGPASAEMRQDVIDALDRLATHLVEIARRARKHRPSGR